MAIKANREFPQKGTPQRGDKRRERTSDVVTSERLSDQGIANWVWMRRLLCHSLLPGIRRYITLCKRYLRSRTNVVY